VPTAARNSTSGPQMGIVIDAVISFAASFGLGGLVAGGVAYFLLKSFLPRYLEDKAKNLATKEDVAAINDQDRGRRAPIPDRLRSLQTFEKISAIGV
jgi:hypothetical protein